MPARWACKSSGSTRGCTSEDYLDFSIADAARELFWERIQKIAANHGVFRIWTQETSPFWTHWGFQPANAETLARLPDEWKNLEGRWLTLELKNEEAISSALENQFAGFMDLEKKQTAQVASRARQITTVLTIIFFAIGFVGIAITVWLVLRHPFQSR